jgi:beta-lactamase superfamily II metal-dependent hydrolase
LSWQCAGIERVRSIALEALLNKESILSKDVLRASIRQLPVGQGGFLLGHIRDEHSHVFTYAFDCGSINREHFEQGLSFCPAGKIDILFVSHLDKDHINGIDALAAHMQIDTVILPCLDPLLVTMIACEEIGEFGLTMSVQEFLADPISWFADRGVKRIYYVQRADDNTATLPFNPNSERSREDRIVPNEDGEHSDQNYTIRSEIVGTPRAGRNGRGIAQTIGQHSSISSNSSFGSPSWLLVPYVHPFPNEKIDLFREAVGKFLPRTFKSRDIAPRAFTKNLLEVLSVKEDRRKLKACYRILSTDNNRPSLSLYSGPGGYYSNITTCSTDETMYWPSPCPHMRVQSSYGGYKNKGGAWLSTGDANLETRETRAPWLERFEHLIDNVNVFILPHHGSNDSIHDEIVMRMKGSTMVVCAASGRTKHPHELLLGRLHTLDQSVWQVSENAESGYTLNVYVSA